MLMIIKKAGLNYPPTLFHNIFFSLTSKHYFFFGFFVVDFFFAAFFAIYVTSAYSIVLASRILLFKWFVVSSPKQDTADG